MRAEETIVCRITQANKGKLERLREEYNNAQKYIQGGNVELYSATRQAMDKYIKKVKEGKEYPLFLRNDTFKVKKAKNTEEFNYWAKIPVANVYGDIWVPVKPHEEIKEDYKIHDSKIVKKDYGFELHLSVSKEVELVENYEGAIGVDMGLNKLAVRSHCPTVRLTATAPM